MPVAVIIVIMLPPLMAIVAVVTTIPVVVVRKVAARSIPIPGKIPFAIMTRANPNSAFEGRTGPVAIMPVVAMSDGIPIALNPDETGARSVRLDEHHGRRRGWCANLNSDRNVCREGGARGHHNES